MNHHLFFTPILTKQLNRLIINIKLLIILCLLGESLNAQKTIKLEDLIQKATINNPLITQKLNSNDILEIQLKQLNQYYLPQTSVQAKASWQSQVTALPISFPGIEVPEIPKDQYKIALDINQTIWDGGRTRAQKKLAMQMNELDQANLDLKISEINQLVVHHFLQIIQADELIKNLSLSKNEILNNRKSIESAIANGIAIQQDLNLLDIHQISIDQKLAEIDYSRLSAIKNLALWTGIPENELSQTVFTTEDSLIEHTSIERKEQVLFDVQKKIILTQLNGAFAQNNPIVSAYINTGYGRPALNFLSPDFDFFTTAGVQLSIPLSHLYTSKNKQNKAIAVLKKEQISESENLFYKQINAQKISIDQQINTVKKWIDQDIQVIENWKNIVQTSKIQWENGEKSTTDYLTELNKRDLAIQQKVLHETQLILLIYQINILLGKY